MNNQTEINKLAIALKIEYDEQDSENKNIIYNSFPIKKMYGITVCCRFEINKFGIWFLINADNINKISEDDLIHHSLYRKHFHTKESSRTIEDYKIAVEFAFNIIPKLVLDNFEGVFVEKKQMIDYSSIFACFENIEHIEMSYDKCCVCYEKTKQQTNCNHYLCIMCWDKIERKYCECNGMTDCDEEGCGNKPCPICRLNIENY